MSQTANGRKANTRDVLKENLVTDYVATKREETIISPGKQGRLLTAQVRKLFFDDHAVLCVMKLDKEKFKDKAFMNRWSASQIKHITSKSNSRLRQKILCDIDYQSFAVVESLFVSRCRRSRWRFVSNEWKAHFRSIFELFRGLLQIVVNVKVNKYNFFGKCNTSLISRFPI